MNARWRSMNARWRALLLVSAALLAVGVGCRGRGGTIRPWEVDLDTLRREAAERPNDPEAQRALAEGELLGSGGDAPRAEAVLARARKLAPDDPEIAFLSALERDLHGDADAALGHYLDALQAIAARPAESGSGPGVSPRIEGLAELAAGSLGSLEGEVSGFPERVGPAVDELAGAKAIPYAAAQALGDLRVRLALRRGEPERAQELAAALGCITDWRVAGPFGPRTLLGFDEPSPALEAAIAKATLEDAHDLGPRRGRRETRAYRSRGCIVHLGDEDLPAGGTTLAEARFRTTGPGPHLIRLETPNPFVLEVGGRPVRVADRRREPGPSLHYVRLDDLAPGDHRLRVRVTTRHPNPVLLVAIGPARGSGGALLAELDRPLDVFLRASLSIARGDPVTARELLRPLANDPEGSPLLLALAASAGLADPLRPSQVRRDEARTLLRAARRDPEAWFPVLQDARLTAAEGQDIEAIAILREARTRWPGRPSIALTLGDLLLGRGWDAEARTVVEAALEAVPDSCPVISMALAVEQRRDRVAAIDRLTDALVACDRQSNAAYRRHLDARRWDAAGEELARLARFEPPQRRSSILEARAELARSRGDDEAADEVLAELRRLHPRDAGLVRQKADVTLAGGARGQALEVVADALARHPDEMAGLHRIHRSLGGPDDLEPYRYDAREVLAAYRSSGRSYDAPDVLVLDTMVVRVYPDGSSRSIVHQIHAIQSEEAVDAHGEFSLPEGADVRTLRTIKADGTFLEPDAIAGKSTISLPNLAVGDFVEQEFLLAEGPSDAFPTGWLGPRFTFQSFETPFDRSELTVVFPESLGELTVDARGPAPAAEERVAGGLRTLTWSVLGSRARTPEPLSVAPREYLPSVMPGVRAGWAPYVESLRDILADRDVVDPAARRLVAEIVGGDPSEVPLRERAERLYGWVLDEIEPTDDAFGLAPAMVAGRTGHRVRVLHYLLGLAGVPSELLLARTVASDQTDAELADASTYVHMILRLPDVPGGEGPVHLHLGSRWAPFGFLPPYFRGQAALELAPGAARAELPAQRSASDGRAVRVEVAFAPDGSARGVVAERYEGHAAVQQRDSLESVPAAVLEQRFEEAYLAQVIRGAQLRSLVVNGDRSRARPVDVRYEFAVARLGRRAGGTQRVPGLFPSQLAPAWAPAASRTTTELVPVPVENDVEVRIRPPAGTPLPDPRPPVDLEGPHGARFSMDEVVEDGALVIRRSLRLPVMRVTPREYPAFAAFCRAVDEAEAREVALSLRPSHVEALEPPAGLAGD